MWVLGVHGGAGETVLATALVGAAAAEHAWPSGPAVAPVLLVARTTMSGLTAAQLAVADWASGETHVTLAGLALIGDAPGKLPRHMADVVARLSGVTPRLWMLPWCTSWRETTSPSLEVADKPLRRALTDLASNLTLNLTERKPQ